jgi:PAS domain S-box-containing protein
MLLSFTFNPFALISLFTSLLVAGLIVFVVRQRYQTSTLRWLVLSLMAILLWSVSEFLIRISGNAETAQLFKYWEIAGYVLVGPAAVGLCLSFVGKERVLSRWSWLLGLFGPAFLMIFAAWTLDLFADFSRLDNWHQAWYGDWVSPLSPFFTLAFVPWFNLLLLFASIQLIRFYIRLENPRRRRQVRVFMVGVIIPSMVGLVTDQLWEPLTHFDMIELATLTTALSGLWITYGIIRYQLFEVNPAIIATNILTTMREVVIVCNPRLEVEYVSDPVKDLLGYQGHEMLGQPLMQYVSDGWLDLRKILTGEIEDEQSIEVSMRERDGHEVPVGLSVSEYLGRRNEVLAYVLVAVDLRQMQELLHVTGERNKLLATLSSISDGVVGIDAEGRIGLANQAFYSMFQLDGQAVDGRYFDDVVRIVRRESPLSLFALLASNTEQRNQRYFDSVTAWSSEDHKVEVTVVFTKLPEQHSVDLMAILTFHNVSRERELEQMKTSFTYLAAHELRTPLTSMRGYLRLLQTEATLPDEQQVLLKRASDSSERLNLMVDRLLEVSAIEQGQLTMHKEKVDIDALLAEVLSRFSDKAEAEGWEFSHQVELQEIVADADRDRIEQVIEILMNNAVQYSDGKAQVVLKSWVEQEVVKISIADRGRGIDTALQKRLFSPFARADQGLQQASQGVGLGLYIAQSIVEMHGGSMEIDSQVGIGSTFTFSLPAVGAATGEFVPQLLPTSN